MIQNVSYNSNSKLFKVDNFILILILVAELADDLCGLLTDQYRYQLTDFILKIEQTADVYNKYKDYYPFHLENDSADELVQLQTAIDKLSREQESLSKSRSGDSSSLSGKSPKADDLESPNKENLANNRNVTPGSPATPPLSIKRKTADQLDQGSLKKSRLSDTNLARPANSSMSSTNVNKGAERVVKKAVPLARRKK